MSVWAVEQLVGVQRGLWGGIPDAIASCTPSFVWSFWFEHVGFDGRHIFVCPSVRIGVSTTAVYFANAMLGRVTEVQRVGGW